MENEIMVNDEVIENAEEIATEQPNKGLLIAAGVGLALVVGTIVYKKVIKPAIAKAKAKKEAKEALMADIEEVDYEEVDS